MPYNCCVPSANPQAGQEPLTAVTAAEFKAAPWLLPPRTPLLPWAGVHGFDQLLALQSQPAGSHPRSVALLLFNKAFAVMAQNSSEWLGGPWCDMKNTS